MKNFFTSNWQLAARDVAHKQELLDFAADCGVTIAHAVTGHYDDKDLYISYFGPGLGLGSLPRRHDSRPTEVVTEHEFREACEAHRLASAMAQMATAA